MIKTCSAAAIFLASLLTMSAPAQVLPAQEVSEEALIDALAPPQLQTRGLSPHAGNATASVGRASLLIEFETNSTALTDSARQQLNIVGRALNTTKLAPYHFVVEGHADPRGSAAKNLQLSQRRAESVLAYLVDSQGVDPSRLQAVGKGDREPLNLEIPAAPENRRVTFVTLMP